MISTAEDSPRGSLTMPPEQDVFRDLAALAERSAGLTIVETKFAMMQSRLRRRLATVGCATFGDYLALVRSDAGRPELQEMISVLTTNVTDFFREEHHFETLRKAGLPDLFDRAKAGQSVRIWSAGCSSGQEPYSIAMTILDQNPDAANYDIRILATDIDMTVLGKAKAGFYDKTEMQGLTDHQRKKFFVNGPNDRQLSVCEPVRELVYFRHLNLMDRWPQRLVYDVIFCRNVVIYFNAETQDALWPRFQTILKPEGWLFLGHSERVSGQSAAAFQRCGVTSYRKAPPDGSPRLKEARHHGTS